MFQASIMVRLTVLSIIFAASFGQQSSSYTRSTRQEQRIAHRKQKQQYRSGSSTTRTILPNVLLIGAQKAGTTTLAGWLFDQAGVCRPTDFEKDPQQVEHTAKEKEVHFFDNHYKRGIGYLSDRFQKCANSRARWSMDATPAYMRYPKSVYTEYKRAGPQHYQRLKIIAILREPVSRELSLYNHMVSRYKETGGDGDQWFGAVATDRYQNNNNQTISFDEYVDKFWGKITGRSGRGMYASHMKVWMKLFDRNQILILSSDELKRDQPRVMRRLESFLSLNMTTQSGATNTDGGESSLFETKNTHDNPDKVRLPSCSTKNKLERAFARANEDLYELLKNNPGPSMEQRPFPRFGHPNCMMDQAVNQTAIREEQQLVI